MERSLYVAFEAYDTHVGANRASFKKMLPEEPGLTHAVDVHGTDEGSQWFRRAWSNRRRDPIFYERFVPDAACGVQVPVALPIVFKPDADDDTVCPECVEVVKSGGGFRPPRGRGKCSDFLRFDASTGHDRVSVYSCVRPAAHGGVHEDSEGATWFEGVESFKPAPR